MDSFDIFGPRKKKRHEDVNVTPILDVMFTIIFFLLVATSFESFTKLTVPPSRVSAASPAEDQAPPANPRVVVSGASSKLSIHLTAAGKSPFDQVNETSVEKLRESVAKMVKEYISKNPAEKTYQLTLESGLSYEILVRAMDGIRENSQDVVLVAPVDAIKGKSLQESVL
jgi:biopolymer transport protein ExbD